MLGGVEVLADDSVGSIDYPVPIFPDKWTPAILASPDHMKHTAAEGTATNKLVTSDEDPPEPTLVLNGWIEPPPPRESVRDLLSELQLTEAIRTEAQRFWDEHIGSASAVAIHLRHGNGENVGLRAAYWLGPFSLVCQLAMNARNDVHRPGLFGRFSDNMPLSLVGTPAQVGAEQRFYRRIATEFHALARSSGTNSTVPFLFCDAAQVVDGMRRELPSLVALPKRLMEPGGGPLHQLNAKTIQHNTQGGIRGGPIPADISREMFVELELMRRCNGLVYMDSGFSLLARFSLHESRVSLLKPDLINRFIVKIMSRLAA
jgi:Nodulation protein Z (NodZ)